MDKVIHQPAKKQSIPRSSVILDYCNKISTPKVLTSR